MTTNISVLAQARVQNQWQEDYVRDLVSLKDYADDLLPPYDTSPTWGQLKAVLMLAGVPSAHRIEVDTRGLQVDNPALTALSGITPQADHMAYFDGATSAALTPFTAFGRSLVALTDADAAQTLLDLPPEVTFADQAEMDASTARKGTVALLQPDQHYVRAFGKWHLIGDWRPQVFYAQSPPTAIATARTGDFATTRDNPTVPTSGYTAPALERVWMNVSGIWVELTDRLVLTHHDPAPNYASVEVAWNAENYTVGELEVPLITFDNAVYLYTGGATATAADFVRLGPRPLRNKDVSTAADLVTEVAEALVGDTFTLVNAELDGDQRETYLYTGNASKPFVRTGDGIRRFSSNTLTGLNAYISSARLGDIGVANGPPRAIYWFDGVEWQPWVHNELKFRRIDSAAALPSIDDDFNNQHISVGDHDIVLYNYEGRYWLYTGPTGDDVRNSREEHFIPFAITGNTPLLPRHEILVAIADGQTVFNTLLPITADNVQLSFRRVIRRLNTDFTVAGNVITFTMPHITVYRDDELQVWYE